MDSTGFREWLLLQEASIVDRSVLDSYERAFRQSLEGLIQRTKDPELRRTFEGMRKCPVHDGSGHCRSWTNYIIGALIRHGCHRKIGPEDALQYIVFNMLSGVGEQGNRRKSLFDFDENRPVDLQQGNPLEALFKIYLANSLRTVCSGKLARLITIHRPTGTISIGQGPEDTGTISADAIPDRPQSGEQEMLEDIFLLLNKRSTPGIDLGALFQSILNGDGTREQRRKFGHDNTDRGRRIIVKTVTDYAHKTQNWHLLNLLDKFKDFSANKADPRPRQKKAKPKPRLSSDPIERDYQSIVGLVQQLGGKLNNAEAGRWRRRWTERKARDPSSPHPNRLVDTFSNMVRDGVLLQKLGIQGGAIYVPGPNFSKYLPQQAPSEG